MASSYYDTYPQDPARHPSISASSLHEGDNDAENNNNNNKNNSSNTKQIPFSFPRKYVSCFLYPCRYVIVIMWLGAVVAGSFFALSFLDETTLEFDPPAGTPARIALDAKQNGFSSMNQSYQPTSDMAIVIYFDQDFLTSSSSSLSMHQNGDDQKKIHDIYSFGSDGTREGSISLPYNISKITEVPSVSAFVDVLNFELLEAAKEFPVVASNHDQNESTLQVQIGNFYLLELAGAHALSSSLLSKTASNALVVPLLLFCEFTSMTCRNYAAKVVEIAQKVENSFLHNETLNTDYNYSSVINKMIGSADSPPPPSSESRDSYSFAAKYNLTASQVQLLSNALRHGTTGMPMLLTSFVDQIQKELGNMDMITLPIALVVMALTVKSLRLLLIPIVSIALTLLIGFSSMYGVAKFLIPVSSAAPPLMLTLAIATGIDYNLFLLTRFADEIRAEEEEDDDEENRDDDDQKGKTEKKRLNNNNDDGDDSQVSSSITSATPSNLSKPGGAFGNQQQKQQNAMNAVSPNSGAYYGATDDDLQFIQYSISKSIAPNQQQVQKNNNDNEGRENSESSKLIATRRKRRDLSKPRKVVDIQKVIANVLRTAGGTVLISGLTLAASFVALIFFPTNILKSFGIACSGTIVVALLVSLNLTPTLLLIFENFFKEGAHAKIWQFVEKKTGDSSSSVCCLYKFTPFVWLCSCFGIEIEIYDEEESDDKGKQHQQKSSSPLRTVIVSNNNNEENSDGEDTDEDEEGKNNASSQPPLPRSSYMSNGSPTTSDVYDLDPELTALEIVRLKMQQKQQKLEQRQRFKLNQQKEQQLEQKRKEGLEKIEKQKQQAAAAAVIPKGKLPGGKKKKKIIKKKKNDDDDNVDADGCVSIVADYRKYHEHSEPEKQEGHDDDEEEEQQQIENNYYSSKFPTRQSGKPNSHNNNNNTRKSTALFESPDVYNVYQSETDNTSNDKTSSSDDEEVREAKKKRRDARERKKYHKIMPLGKSGQQQQQQKYSPEMHEEKEETNKTNNRLNNNNSKAYGALADSFSFALSAAAADAENEKRKSRQEEEEEENIRMQNEKHPLLNLHANKPEKRKKIDMSAIFSRFKSHLPSFQNEKEPKSEEKMSNSKKHRSDENDVVLVSSINSDHLYETSIFRHIEKILIFPWNFIIFLLFCGLIGFCGSKVAQLRIEDSTLAFLAKGTYPYTSYVTLQEYFGGGAMMPYRILFTSSSSSSTSSIYSQEFVSFAHSVITNISAATNTPLFLFRGLYAIDGKLVHREDFTNCLDFIENKTSNSTCNPNVLLMMLNSQIVNHDESAAIVLMTCPIHPTSSQGTAYYNNLLSTISQVEQQQKQYSSSPANFNAYVLGLAAETVDAMKVVFDHFPLIGAISMLVVVLMVSVTFRSIVVPIRCIISILFTEVFVFGLSVLVYQDGDLSSLNWSYLSGHQSILWLTPIVAYSFLLGVALDFDIFLLTRIVEIITVEKKRTTNATVRGLCGTITIINACGFVMTIAFSGLFFSNIRVLNELGFMLVVAVLFDTFVVRTLLVPCVMSMLGRVHWWPNNLEAVIDQLEKDVKLQSEFEGRYDKKTGEVRVPLEVHEGSGLLSLAAMK